jgi:hypothetical protein
MENLFLFSAGMVSYFALGVGSAPTLTEHYLRVGPVDLTASLPVNYPPHQMAG